MSADKAQSGAGSTVEGARGPQMASPGHGTPRSKGFKAAHLSMMALGSAIGAGFFLGTGVAVSEAGPAVLVCAHNCPGIMGPPVLTRGGFCAGRKYTGDF